MPPRSRYTRKRTRRSTRSKTLKAGWRKRERKATGGLVARTAKAAWKGVKELRRETETQMLGGVLAGQPNNWGGQTLRPVGIDNTGAGLSGTPPLSYSIVQKPMRGMGRGDDSAQRTGDVITMNSLSYKVAFKANNTAAGDVYNRVGCVIVLDTRPDQGDADQYANLFNAMNFTQQPGPGSLMNGQSAPTTDPNFAWLNLNTCKGPKQRFKILKWHKGGVQAAGTYGATYKPVLQFNGTLKGRYRIHYQSDVDDPNIALPVNQEILFFYYSDSTTIPHPTVESTMRFRFKDA